jgi:predicted glycoside hydrolase/deacetylase ChbG (UPF0249 family)
VVEGIAEAHEIGIVTSTSLMVNAPAAEAAFEEARRLPSLAIGLHFVLTFGRPLGPLGPLSRLLDQDGNFRNKESGAHEGARPDEVRDELRAQLRAFEKGAGRPPTHIDGHHHVHLHPGILRAAIEEAGRLSIPLRSTGRDVRERLRLERIRTCDRFFDGFYGDDVSEARLLSWSRFPRERASSCAIPPVPTASSNGSRAMFCHAFSRSRPSSLPGSSRPSTAWGSTWFP